MDRDPSTICTCVYKAPVLTLPLVNLDWPIRREAISPTLFIPAARESDCEEYLMHPAFFHWWKHNRAHSCGAEARTHMGDGHMGHERPFGGGPFAHAAPDHDGGAFGVRRPLRFLSRNLDLTEEQVADLARILGHLKTERAQAEVDQQRSVGAFAEALEAESLDESKLTEGIAVREASQERVRAAVRKALLGIHGLLGKEQRSKFAYLLRTGALSI